MIDMEIINEEFYYDYEVEKELWEDKRKSEEYK